MTKPEDITELGCVDARRSGDCDGFVMMVSGGSGTLNQLPHDWIYWETGKVTSDARRQLVQTRSTPALVAIILGAIAIVIVRWKLVRRFSKARIS